jgi:hypothetical protein
MEKLWTIESQERGKIVLYRERKPTAAEKRRDPETNLVAERLLITQDSRGAAIEIDLQIDLCRVDLIG